LKLQGAAAAWTLMDRSGNFRMTARADDGGHSVRVPPKLSTLKLSTLHSQLSTTADRTNAAGLGRALLPAAARRRR
jgi:hypothetical protein